MSSNPSYVTFLGKKGVKHYMPKFNRHFIIYRNTKLCGNFLSEQDQFEKCRIG